MEEHHKKDNSNSSFKKVFKSASGDEMIGYMVDAKNTTIGDTTLDHFYYYLIPQNKRQVALVGNDFLDFCSYSHDICGNIKINTIDMEKYKDSVKDSISVDEVISIIDEIIEKREEQKEYTELPGEDEFEMVR